MASEHLSRYILASKLAHGVTLDCATGSGYGASILRRGDFVKSIISVDIDKSLCKYGKVVYNTNCVCADAGHLPFREQSFDSVVSIETLEHVKSQKAFITNVKSLLKGEGNLVLSTPNKLYTSPFLPTPLNPYHVNEYYLGQLLTFLESNGFEVNRVYGGRRVRSLELIRRTFGSLLKFLLHSLSLKPYFIDIIYHSIKTVVNWRRQGSTTVMDPDPTFFPHVELRAASNIVLHKYFVIHAYKS